MSESPDYNPNWISRRFEAAGRLWSSMTRWLPQNYFSVIGVYCALLVIPWAVGIILLAGNVLDLLRTPVGADYRPTAYALGVSLTALAGLIAAPLVIVRTYVSERQTAVAEKGHITDRFSKAIEQLGEEKIAIRLGAIYALEQVARDSETYHIPVMETLCAFIRVNAPASMAPEPLPPWDADLPEYVSEEIREAAFDQRFGSPLGNLGDLSKWVGDLEAPRVDIQAALTVIGRRREEHIAREREGDRPFALDLRQTCLIRADLSKARLDHALLTGARLEGAHLTGAQFEKANLSGDGSTERPYGRLSWRRRSCCRHTWRGPASWQHS